MKEKGRREKNTRFEPQVCRSRFYKIRVPQWFVHSFILNCDLWHSRQDNTHRMAVDHRSLEDCYAHGTDLSLGLDVAWLARISSACSRVTQPIVDFLGSRLWSNIVYNRGGNCMRKSLSKPSFDSDAVLARLYHNVS